VFFLFILRGDFNMENLQLVTTKSLVGKTGTIVREIIVVDAKESAHGINIRVRESGGDEYWTNLDNDISLD
jgi:hypothetical protein